QEAKLKLARAGADYFVFRGGKASVGQMVLGSAELRDLRRRVDTAVYSTGNREITLREDGFPQALRLVDAILAARRAALGSRCKWRILHETTCSFRLCLARAARRGLWRDDLCEPQLRRRRRRREPADLEGSVPPVDGAGAEELRRAEARLPQARLDGVRAAQRAGDHIPRAAVRGRGAGEEARRRHQRRQGQQGDRAVQEAVLRRQRRPARKG